MCNIFLNMIKKEDALKLANETLENRLDKPWPPLPKKILFNGVEVWPCDKRELE